MLPDFPEIKSRWRKIFLKFMKEQMHGSSIMAEIKAAGVDKLGMVTEPIREKKNDQ